MPKALSERIGAWLDRLLWRVLHPTIADVWDECATECGDRGWMHDYAVEEMKDRNPYRIEDYLMRRYGDPAACRRFWGLTDE